jgi:hypothetical protein
MNFHIFTLSLLTVAAFNMIYTPDDTSESLVNNREPKNIFGKAEFHDNRAQSNLINIKNVVTNQSIYSTESPILQKYYVNEMTIDDLKQNYTSDIRIVFVQGKTNLQVEPSSHTQFEKYEAGALPMSTLVSNHRIGMNKLNQGSSGSQRLRQQLILSDVPTE